MADLKKQVNAPLQKRLEAFITEIGSQEKAAGQIGYSAGALSTYRAGKYMGDIVKLEARLSEFFGIKDAAEEFNRSIPDYVPTSISQKVYNTIRLCHLKGGLAVECGDAGIGKTKAAKKYLADYPGSTVFVTVNPCLASTAAFMKLLCKTCHIPFGRKDDMWLALDEYFQGGKKVLIIDEAQHLPIKTIESIRALFDDNADLGIIFIGNIETVTNRTNKGRTSFAQINNRTKLTEIRHTTHIKKDDIAMLCPALAGCDREIEFLHVIAQSEQGVRGAINLFSNAADNGNITYEGLIAMARAMKMVSGGFANAG